MYKCTGNIILQSCPVITRLNTVRYWTKRGSNKWDKWMKLSMNSQRHSKHRPHWRLWIVYSKFKIDNRVMTGPHYIPGETQRNKNVIVTSKRRRDFVLTLSWCYCFVMYPLVLFANAISHHASLVCDRNTKASYVMGIYIIIHMCIIHKCCDGNVLLGYWIIYCWTYSLVHLVKKVIIRQSIHYLISKP